MNQYGHYIDGRQVPAEGGQWLASEDPYTGETWARIARGDRRDADAAVSAAHRAFADPAWRALAPSARGALIRRFADLLATEVERLATIEQRDNGKLLSEVRAQVGYLPAYYHYYAGLADKVQGAVLPIDRPGVLAHTRRVPRGVVAIITPWNSPLTLTSWKLAPALAAGCTVVIKPSEYTSCAIVEFAELFERAGFPAGVVNVVTGFGGEAGEALVADPRVAHVGFTGGEDAGARVYELAARGLKTVTLELGGKSPHIVFDDADLDEALPAVVSGIFAASGQSCQAGSRLLVQESIREPFVRRLVELARSLRLGDPRDPATQVGPIATRAQFEKVKAYLELGLREGACCAAGGRARAELGAGQFIEPTIFTGVNPGMRIAQEEVFGPVLCVIGFEDDRQAIRIANDIRYGLAAGVWTRSLARALRCSEALEAGTVWINAYRATSFTAPFGGMKRSGIGRESGIEAIDEYLDTRCIWMKASGENAQ